VTSSSSQSPLGPGSRLGPYEITTQLGSGGMDEVYRATDTRLHRDVAIKVLPPTFTADPERLARFEREAQLLAQLNHPNIAAIHGLEESGGIRALVMELVEGPTLADRLAHGALPLEESLAIARRIAQALEEAHQKGIVHRDLKPQNVKASVDGKVKVLDFGLAKAMDPVGGAAGTPSQLAQSPTLTLGATAQGVILGTAAYMSPEQARGLPVDKRADIWAFGVLAFEMLTGQTAFAAATVTDTLAAVLTREIDWSALPATVPPALRRLLRRCLERDPRNRLHDIADARIVLAEIERGDADFAEHPSGEPGRGGALGARGWVAVAIVASLAGAAIGRWVAPAPRSADSAGSAPRYVRLTNETGYVHSARFTPDGESVVFGEAQVGAPVRLFSSLATSPGARRFDLPSADVVGISRDSRMALLLDRRHEGSWLRVGTLAQASLAGGAVRPMAERAYDAAISPNGDSFAIVRQVGAVQRLEYPLGTVLYETSGWISSPRISRDGRRVAFADHPIRGDDQGYVSVAEGRGSVLRVSGLTNFLHGVVWSADGEEVLASHGNVDAGTYFREYRLNGEARDLLSSPGFMRIHDVSADGRLLLTADAYEVATEGRLATGAGAVDHYASWVGESFAGISDDGRLAAGQSGALGEDNEYQAFYRSSEAASGAPPVMVGSGSALGLSPDGEWVFVANALSDRSILRAEPTRAGETRRFDLGDLVPNTSATGRLTATRDGRRVSFLAAREGELERGYVFDLEGDGAPRPVTGAGASRLLLSPSGDRVVALDAEAVLRLYDVEGGAVVAVSGVRAGEVPVAWSSNGDAIFVWDRTMPVRVDRLDLATGRREPAIEWKPRDPNGMLYALLTVSTDAKYFIVRYRRGRSSLVVAELGP